MHDVPRLYLTTPPRSQMLADACVPVATHRHGCCVLQRAIDAATVDQSKLLVSQVTKHALLLMQVHMHVPSSELKHSENPVLREIGKVAGIPESKSVGHKQTRHICLKGVVLVVIGWSDGASTQG